MRLEWTKLRSMAHVFFLFVFFFLNVISNELVRVSGHVDDFNTPIKVLTAKRLRQGYRYHKLRKAFSKLIGGILT